MGKKNKRTAAQPQALSAPPTESISRNGKTLMAAGMGTVAAGFIVLSFADPMGRNWAAVLAPFLVLGGYALLGLGIFLPSQTLGKTTE
ncbi:MAG: hypothetical protein HY924_05505 [Elusimicrobia bacterium]|nr:hypothetical protein [Elusimicrobiota bacterium]